MSFRFRPAVEEADVKSTAEALSVEGPALVDGRDFERPINVRGGIVAWQRAGLPIDH
jgi:rhodanese-related sulfurtransferase